MSMPGTAGKSLPQSASAPASASSSMPSTPALSRTNSTAHESAALPALDVLRFATRTHSGTYLPVAGDHATASLSSCFSKAALMSACEVDLDGAPTAATNAAERLHLYVYMSAANQATGSGAQGGGGGSGGGGGGGGGGESAPRSQKQMTLTLDATVKAFLHAELVAASSSDIASTGAKDEEGTASGLLGDALRRDPFAELARRAVRTMAHATFAAVFDVLPAEQAARDEDEPNDTAASGAAGGAATGATNNTAGAASASATSGTGVAAAVSGMAAAAADSTRRSSLFGMLFGETRAEQLQFQQRSPLLFVSSLHLNAFPWQLITQRSVRQFFTLRDVANAHRTSSRTALSPVPLFMVFVDNPVLARASGDQEDQRRKNAYVDTLRALNATTVQRESGRPALFLAPLHAPVVSRGKRATAFRKKFRALTLIDSAHFADAVLRSRGALHADADNAKEPANAARARPKLKASSSLLLAFSSNNAIASTAVSTALAAFATDARSGATHRAPFALLMAAVRASVEDAERTLACLLLTFADLLEFNDLLVDVARSHQRLVMLFVPAALMKVVGRRIDDVAEDYAKLRASNSANSAASPHSFLSALVASLSAAGVPLAAFNLHK
jgi:hypothetical protein